MPSMIARPCSDVLAQACLGVCPEACRHGLPTGTEK